MANIKSIQLLRNTSKLYATREAALAALTGNTVPAAATDGTPVLARYKNESGVIITLVGYYAVSSAITDAGTATTHMTVFDYEGNIADIEELKNRLGTGITTANTATAQLTALSGNNLSTSADTSVEGAKRYADGLIDSLDVSDTAVPGSYVSQVSETNGKISVSRVALPDASSVADENKIVTDVTQDKGAITATASLLSGVKLSGYTVGGDDSGKIAETDTLGQALGKLQGQIKGMDKAASAEDGKVVTTVTEVDGKVTETKANVKDLQLGGYQLDNSTGPIASADTINVALSKLENKVAANHISNDDASITVTEQPNEDTDIMVNIKSGEKVIRKDGGAGIWTDIAISAVTGTELTNLGTNVKEAYKLVDSYGGKLGEYVKIYKDSALVDFFLGHVDDKLTDADPTTQESPTSAVTSGTGDTALVYIMQLANGNYKLTAVDVEDFIEEAEFASGVTWDNEAHKVKGVVDLDSEKDESNVAFLTVGANGFKVSGIKDAIDTKINKLDADLSGNTTHVTVNVVEANGIVTGVNIVEDNIANANDLAALSAKTVTEVGSSNDSISATSSATTDGTVKYDIVTDASKVKMTGFTAETSGLTAITTASTITEAVKAIESEIIRNEEITSTALNDLEDRKAEKTDVNTMYNHLEDEIRELQSGTSADLADEIAARKAVDGQNGQRYVANAGKKYISGATSLNDADILLNDAIENITGNWIEGVQINGKDLLETSNKVNAQFSASTTYSDSANAIVITQDDATGGLTFALGTLDAGTY